jgi:hypothetical protein
MDRLVFPNFLVPSCFHATLMCKGWTGIMTDGRAAFVQSGFFIPFGPSFPTWFDFRGYGNMHDTTEGGRRRTRETMIQDESLFSLFSLPCQHSLGVLTHLSSTFMSTLAIVVFSPKY